MVSVVPRLLLALTVFAVLLAPAVSVPKARLVGEREIGGSLVPARFTNWGETTALSLMVISPEMLPATEGVKVTMIEHLAPTAKVDGLIKQLLLWVKFPLAFID